MDGTFKCCGKCFKAWRHREDLVRDPDLILIGYQPTFGPPNDGLLLFTHVTPDCGSTLAVPVRAFEDYIRTRDDAIRLVGTSVCPGHCLRVHDLQACHVPCQMRWVRQLIQILRRHEVPMINPLSPARTSRARQRA